MEEYICNRCVKQSVCKNYVKEQNVVGCIEFLSIKRTDYLTDDELLDKIRTEIVDTGAYEQETNGKTEFLKGINYCLSVIDKCKAESED